MRWIAHTCSAKGHVLTNCFGVKKHGFDQAMHLAIAARERHLEQMNGRVSYHRLTMSIQTRRRP
jgi:hypothetical protein